MAKSKKKKKNHLPKRIAGVKMPKSVRRGRLGELLASPVGQTLLTEAILGAGAAAASIGGGKSPKVRRYAHDTAERLRHGGGEATHDAVAAGSTLTYAIGEAARSFAEALHRGEPPDQGAERSDGPSWATDGEDVSERRPRKQSKAREAAP